MRRTAPFARRPLLALPAATVAAVAAVLAVPPGPAGAQAPAEPRPVGPELSATVSQRFELDTNLDLEDPSPGVSSFAETRLQVGLLEETPVQRFSLGFDTGLRALWRAEEDLEFTFASPSSASAAYAQEWASGNVDTSVRYTQRRVDFTRSLLDFLDPDLGVIVVPDDLRELEGEASERRYDANIGLALATDRPSSYAFSFTGNRIDYSAAGASLTPRTTLVGNATWNLRLNPVFSGTLGGRLFWYEAENPQETEIREAEVDVGVAYDPTQVLRLTAGVGYLQRERLERPAPGQPQQTIEDTGVSLRATANYQTEEFVVVGSLRAVSAPETRLSGNLSVYYPLMNGSVNARLFQNYAGGVGGEEIRVTGAGIGLLRELDQQSRINFDLAGSRRENVDNPADPDVDRIDFSTTFGYDVTRAISANIGYRFRLRNEAGESADSHAVFVQIGRTFVTGPF